MSFLPPDPSAHPILSRGWEAGSVHKALVPGKSHVFAQPASLPIPAPQVPMDFLGDNLWGAKALLSHILHKSVEKTPQLYAKPCIFLKNFAT